MTDDDVPIKVVGFGPFPLPGEKKRRRKALEEARETLRIAEEIQQRGERPKPDDGDQ